MPMNAQNQTENLTIHHKVKDYAIWRKGYDDHEKARHAAGVTNGSPMAEYSEAPKTPMMS
jgi:hypothetical protein